MHGRRYLSYLSLTALLVVGCSTRNEGGKPSGQADSQAQAIERITGLGGEVEFKTGVPHKAIEKAHLIGDKFTDAELGALSAFPDLRVVSLLKTATTGEGMAKFAGLKSLRVLGLSGANVTDAFLQRVAELEQVEELVVDNTAITPAGWAELSRMRQLRHLELVGQGVSDADLPALAKLRQLHTLRLRLGTITEKGVAHLSGMGLERLVVPEAARANAMLKPYLAALKAPVKLLVLQSWKIDDAGMEHLAGLGELTELYLSDTRVGDEGLKRLSGLTKLEKLDLRSTRVTNAGLDHLSTLKGLKTLLLSGSNVTSEGKKKLAAKLPKLEIDPPFEGF